MLKRLLIILFALLGLCACQSQTKTYATMIANPFTNCASLEEAEELSGIQLTLPGDLAACEEIVYRAANSEALQLLEVIVDWDGNEIRLRKSPGKEDNSGMYEEFAIAVENADGERGLIMKGDGNGLYRLAIWQDGEYSCSISCEEALAQETLYDWVCTTK